jgi:GNAT superfamily N-acetyltransferase
MDLSRIFYFGESVLLSQYRGQGVGVRFFEEREKAARDHGYSQTAFLRRGAARRSSRAPTATTNRWTPSGASAAISGAAT